MTQQTAQEIDQEAADWAAKVDRGLSAEEQSRLDLWLTGDLRRLGAYGRIRAVALQTERVAALGPVHSPHDFGWRDAATLSRRKLLGGGGAIAAGLAAFGFAGWAWLRRGHFQTRKGEVRQMALQDGSVVTLNTASRVAMRLSAERREFSLLEGEVLFDVAKDRSRPFIVTAGDTQIRVLGTSFIVRALPGEPVQVLVREGVVDVRRTDRETLPPRRLLANMRAVSPMEMPDDGHPMIAVDAVPEAEVRRALAWRDGHIDFEGETLGQAVTEFTRYTDTRIVVAPALAREQIAGLYQINDPVGFARAVAASLRATAEISDGEIRLSQ